LLSLFLFSASTGARKGENKMHGGAAKFSKIRDGFEVTVPGVRAFLSKDGEQWRLDSVDSIAGAYLTLHVDIDSFLEGRPDVQKVVDEVVADADVQRARREQAAALYWAVEQLRSS
jgi:hypothetical protein